MTDYSDVTVATNAVTDPSTSGADLASIAGAHPSLYQAVAGHPNAYPELITWIAAQGAVSAPTVPNPVAQAPQVVPAAQAGYSPQPISPANTGLTSPSWAPPAGGGYVPPITPGAGYPMPAMQPKKSRTGLLVGVLVGVVALIGAGIGLFIWQPWNSNSTGGSNKAGAELSVDQFAYLLMNNRSLYGANTSSYRSEQELARDLRDDPDSSRACRELSRELGADLSCEYSFEGNNGGLLLFTTEREARQAAQDIAGFINDMIEEELGVYAGLLEDFAGFDITGTDKPGSPDGHGVWYWRMSASLLGESMDAYVVQYGNVLIVSGDENSRSSGRDFSSYLQQVKESIDEAGRQ